MPPKPHKAKQRRATAASKKNSKKGSTALHKSALSIPERVVLKNMDRRYRSGSSSSSSSSSSSEFEAPQPPRRVRQPPVKLPPTPPPAVAKPPVPRARTVAAKKAHAPTVKKLPEKRNGRRGGSGDERTLRMGHRDQWIMPPQQATLPARRVLLKRDRRRESPDDCNLMSPPAPRPNGHDQRPVDVLKTLCSKTCTKEGFLRMAIATVTPSHCISPSNFWKAFRSIAYLGKGRFGLVWRCTTLDGAVVAVKSCPVSFHSSKAIEDGFSVLREVAVMRFLNEQNVPYVLPYTALFSSRTPKLCRPVCRRPLCIPS
ncbi:protein kinase, putative [Bodo saltans]|uniref:Protein kinase, putative n=1 Tax=Bodo saltans TaxID=75058 RepID=A0A0S4IRD5_BODSA|nr:protein kinase, putative [Bodo saltans]|eukprot:CUG01667.1 protein kinase, putative [Bodo saltans]